VPSRGCGGEKVPGLVHPHQLRCQIEEQGRIELAAVCGRVRVEQQIFHLEGEHIHCEYPRVGRSERAQRFLVGIVAVGREDDELLHARFFP